MRARAVRGTSISVVGQGVAQVLRFGSNLILSRLLFPEAFGLMALVTMIIVGLEMLSDLGVQISIIQNKRGDEADFLDTAWTISVARGAFLWTCGIALAWPMAAFYEEPLLGPMIAVATSSALITGAHSTKLHLLHRHIRLGKIVGIDLCAQATNVAAMILIAWKYQTVWSLVVGTMGATLVKLIASHVILPGRHPKLRWEKEAAHEIITFGKWIFVSTVITFAATRVDVAMLGKLIPKDVLGVYNFALMLAMVPMMLGGQAIGSVLLPALSRSFHQAHHVLIEAFVNARRALLPLGLFLMSGIGLGGPPLFYYLWDERYHDASWMVRILAITYWFFLLQEASGRALQAVGDARSLAIANAVKLVITASCCYFGFEYYGLVGFMLGAAIGALAGHSVIVWRLNLYSLPSGAVDLGYTVFLFALGGSVFLVTNWIESTRGHAAAMGWSVAIASAILIPMGLWTARRLTRLARAPKPATP